MVSPVRCDAARSFGVHGFMRRSAKNASLPARALQRVHKIVAKTI
jgi:hypothetical protein